MHAWGVTPNQMSFNTVMDAYARQGNVNNVVKIYNYMQVRQQHTRKPSAAGVVPLSLACFRGDPWVHSVSARRCRVTVPKLLRPRGSCRRTFTSRGC